ncbi:MAG: prephenate dehydratase [Acidobacteriia bacterium]|nr:prephenate dehydratase [Terriglobia bacterium]
MVRRKTTGTDPTDRLATVREALDRTDRKLLETLLERLAKVRDVARLKKEGVPFLRDHEREAELLSRVEGWARELGLDPFRVREIYREVIAMSVKVQEEALLRRESAARSVRHARRVAYQGGEGSYSHIAARKYFAERAGEMEFHGFPTFSQALREAEGGEAGYAFLPIENTTAGSINETYDLLRSTDLAIVGEEVLEVRHCLLAAAPTDPASLRRILSHPQALTQCAAFLRGLPGAEPVAYEDTAEAARKVREDSDPAQAAIASEEAAALHGLVVIARDIADQPENWTRFVLVSSLELRSDPRIPSKTSLVLTTPHRHGALAHCLAVLAEHGLNLTKLESRPVPRRPWEYLFYIDFEGSLAEEAAAHAVAALRRECPYLKVLGSYPARTTARGRVD